ncbi:hypothetical protein SAMN05444000_1381 [Shimia gijangensis]|uniref:HNH endonuclease n=1 Tax=Shimia gijangensis TaxID=1470563 RepID=A0A1M6TC58_9RHOB|nr:hypothetical protein [Shimia gijangensis]SHK54642.1 hypothetical protein SAMN05444000_1381 [Shimia gijangensis]
MKKLNVPEYPSIELFDNGVEDLNAAALSPLFLANRQAVQDAYVDFHSETLTQTWSNLPKARHGHPTAIIVGGLSKENLVKLYDEGVVKSKGQARKIYDSIKLAAHDECPYCGGVGEIGSLDHYLPKARFPAYSVLPSNLVPACDVCNKGMGSNFPSNPNLQPLHPYFDAPHFFDEKWTIARVSQETPIVVSFDVAAPPGWSVKDQSRVAQHFEDCNLGERYRSRVWSELAPLISQRKSTLRMLDAIQFRAHLSVIATEPELPINGWKRTLYHALAASNWFCSADFTAPTPHLP